MKPFFVNKKQTSWLVKRLRQNARRKRKRWKKRRKRGKLSASEKKRKWQNRKPSWPKKEDSGSFKSRKSENLNGSKRRRSA